MNERIQVGRLLVLLIYKLVLSRLPASNTLIVGPFCRKLRGIACSYLFQACGGNVNIDRNVRFGYGRHVVIGDNSGIGKCSSVTEHINIGKDVMIGPGLQVFASNHKIDDTIVPMRLQGTTGIRPVKIEDDVWIGANVMIMPGRVVEKGSVIAGGTVLTKDFPPYSIIGGNPSRLIRSRK